MCENCSSPKESILKCLKQIYSANARINSICVSNSIFVGESKYGEFEDFEKIEDLSNIIFHNSKQIMNCLSHIEEIPPDD